ncbi:MAG: hypothetical protein AB7G87_01410 [Clostridia bacterium]
MERFQIEKLYKVNGLGDYKLKSPVDLVKTHGIDYIEINGFNRLNDLQKLLFSKFIVNYFNGYGLKTRCSIVPKGIYFVEEVEYLVKEDSEDDIYTIVGEKVLAIDRNGLKTVHHYWKNETFDHIKEQYPGMIIESQLKQYLRFEYVINGHPGWQHVISDKEWY